MNTSNQATVPATIGDRIKKLREARKMSQKTLAIQLDIGATNISKWEAGAFPSLDNLCKLAKVFAVTLDYLVYGVSKNGVSKDDENCVDLTGMKLQQIRLIKALIAELKQS